jgi:hypothetical protein
MKIRKVGHLEKDYESSKIRQNRIPFLPLIELILRTIHKSITTITQHSNQKTDKLDHHSKVDGGITKIRRHPDSCLESLINNRSGNRLVPGL